MSQLTHPQPQALRLWIPPRVWLAVVTLIAGAAIAFFFVISGGDEATQTPNTAVSDTAAGIRYDGGPEEGSHGIRHSNATTTPPAGIRYDGVPEGMTKAAYRALHIRSEALNNLYGNAVTRLSPAQFAAYWNAGASRLSPDEFNALVVRSEGLNSYGKTPQASTPVASTSTTTPPAGIRYDGGPEEGGHGIRYSNATTTPPAGIRYDGGPEEGTSGIQPSSTANDAPSGIRYDGGPEEGMSGVGR